MVIGCIVCCLWREKALELGKVFEADPLRESQLLTKRDHTPPIITSNLDQQNKSGLQENIEEKKGTDDRITDYGMQYRKTNTVSKHQHKYNPVKTSKTIQNNITTLPLCIGTYTYSMCMYGNTK